MGVSSEATATPTIKMSTTQILWTFLGVLLIWYAGWMLVDYTVSWLPTSEWRVAVSTALGVVGLFVIMRTHPHGLQVIV
jgi:hypothetical protein